MDWVYVGEGGGLVSSCWRVRAGRRGYCCSRCMQQQRWHHGEKEGEVCRGRRLAVVTDGVERLRGCGRHLTRDAACMPPVCVRWRPGPIFSFHGGGPQALTRGCLRMLLWTFHRARCLYTATLPMLSPTRCAFLGLRGRGGREGRGVWGRAAPGVVSAGRRWLFDTRYWLVALRRTTGAAVRERRTAVAGTPFLIPPLPALTVVWYVLSFPPSSVFLLMLSSHPYLFAHLPSGSQLPVGH